MGLKTPGNLISIAAKGLKRKHSPPDLDALAEGEEDWVEIVKTRKNKQRQVIAAAAAADKAKAEAKAKFSAVLKATQEAFEESEDDANEKELGAKETVENNDELLEWCSD